MIGRIRKILALLLAIVPEAASGHIIEVFGTSSRSQGMGSTGIASASDFSVLYYNPALLIEAPDTFSIEFQQAYADMSVLLMDRPAGYDPKYYGYLLNERSDLTSIPSLWAVTLGATFDFGSDVLSAGFVALLPSSGVGNQESHFPDEREQHFSNSVRFELLGERLQTQTILAAVAMRATRWLDIGFGFSFGTLSNSSTDVYTPNPADPSAVDLNLKVNQDSALALTAGVLADLGAGFRLGFSARDESAFELTGSNIIQLHGLEGKEQYVLEQPMDFTLHYSPRTYGAGLAYADDLLTVAADASWVMWSRYPSAQGENAGFQDTFDFSLGAEIALAKARARLGLRYTPSPVREQTGRTNFADNDRITLASGVGGQLRVLGSDLGVDLHVQVVLLPERTHGKEALEEYPACGAGVSSICDEEPGTPGLQTGNPGFPGFSSGGLFLAGGFTLTWTFGE